MVFSRMRRKGSNFFHSGDYGGLGVEGVFAKRCATVRNRPQPSATVRNCSREVAMTVPLASSAKAVTFAGFKARFAWQAWHFVTFQHGA